MFSAGDVIDDGYRVTGVCSQAGGMGVILHVTSLKGDPQQPVVLKYCRDSEEEQLARFRREVRLLASFAGNSRVVQLVGHNLDHDPPYFVMKYCPDGDVSKLMGAMMASPELQERYFLQMIDCIQELHSRNKFHRDIKPANFLVDGDQVVVSDFGLTTELGSSTAFTRSSVWWGTHGYIPPEFLGGGFKHADAAGDIFMLGKTFYVLLTGREPMYLDGTGVPPPVFHIIERCCNVSKDRRYKTLAELKQSMAAAYDVLLQRAGGLGKLKQLLSSIQERMAQGRGFSQAEVSEFVEQLALIDSADQIRVCYELQPDFFSVIGQAVSTDRLSEFLTIYERLVEARDYAWSYAETIAGSMRRIFDCASVSNSDKAFALKLAIRAADHMNRFAAMNACKSMIASVNDEHLGLQVATLILENRDTFVASVEPSECGSESIRAALRQIQNAGRSD